MDKMTLTIEDQKLLHSYVTDGKGYRTVLISVCPDCEYEEWDDPDYTSRAHFPDLTGKLFGDREMWFRFRLWVARNHMPEYWADRSIFLFSDNARFCSLLCQFLRLPDTVREFGEMECKWCSGTGQARFREWVNCTCQTCNGTGRIPTPWAAHVKKEMEDAT